MTTMRVIPTPADGDCYYHAFIKGLLMDDERMQRMCGGLTPLLLRRHVAQQIVADKDLYDDMMREWIDFDIISHKDIDLTNGGWCSPEVAANHIVNSKEWATSTVIHILAVAFNVRVVVYQKINGQYYPEVFPSAWKRKSETEETPKHLKTVYLLRRGPHFELLKVIEPPSNEPPQTVQEGPFPNTQSYQDYHFPQRGGGKKKLKDRIRYHPFLANFFIITTFLAMV
jgi:hypothetical protein